MMYVDFSKQNVENYAQLFNNDNNHINEDNNYNINKNKKKKNN